MSVPGEGALFLRDKQLLRQDKIDEARAKREAADKAAKLADDERKAKKLEVEVLIEKGRSTRAQLRVISAEAKADKEKVKQHEKEARQVNKKRSSELAALICKKITKFFTDDSGRASDMKDVVDDKCANGKRPRLKHAAFPEFIEFMPSNFRNYSVKRIGAKPETA